MSIVRYLPSAQFMLIVGSVLLSGGLVVAAKQVTAPPKEEPVAVTTSPAGVVSTGDWLASLRAIEGDDVGTVSTSSPNLDELLASAQSSNVTDTVGKSLLIKLSEAKGEGLGSDVPTQDKLVADVIAQIQQNKDAPTYTTKDIVTVDGAPETLKTYGNKVMTIVGQHRKAGYVATILAIGDVANNKTPGEWGSLAEIGSEYKALARDLAMLKVPTTLVPFHLQAINNFAYIASLYDDIAALIDDPLRGLAGFQTYEAINDETRRVFINIAQELSRNGILFNKDEPGATWSSLLSP